MSPHAVKDVEEPLLRPSLGRASSNVEEVPPGLLAYEHQNSRLHERGSHWLQVPYPA